MLQNDTELVISNVWLIW